MIPISSLVPAEVGQPLFGNQWLALAAVLACVAALFFGIAGVARWLAATHPDEPVAPPPQGREHGPSRAVARSTLLTKSVNPPPHL